MRTIERSFEIDRNLARRAEMKELRSVPQPVPSVIEFDAHGEHFVADITHEADGYSAQVRNHPECYTCGDDEAELRKNLVEAAELAIFDIADEVYA